MKLNMPAQGCTALELQASDRPQLSLNTSTYRIMQCSTFTQRGTVQGSRCRTQGPRRSSKWRAENIEDRRYTQVQSKQRPRGSSTSVSGDAIANKHTLCYRLYCRYYQCQSHTLHLVGLRHMLHFLAKLADEFILLLFCGGAVGPELQVLLLPLRLTALKVCQQLQGNVYGQWICVEGCSLVLSRSFQYRMLLQGGHLGTVC